MTCVRKQCVVVKCRYDECNRWWSAAILVLLWFVAEGFGSPLRHNRPFVDDKVQKYLMNFGYLPQSDVESGNLRTEEQLTDAIKTLQRYGGLEQTGVIDDETASLLHKPRCGLPDTPDGAFSEPSALGNHPRAKRYTLQGQMWSYTNITWSLRTPNPANLERGAVRRELSRALAVWEKHSRLTFQEIDSDSADILVYFFKGYHGDGYAFDGRGDILAHAFFPGTGRGGDAHFDEEEKWLTDEHDEEVEGTSLFNVAAHEFGHSLGLSHSSVQGSLMYPWYQGMPPNFELPEDDRHGIQQMYGSRETKMWGNIPRYPITTTTPSTTTTTTTTTTERTRYYGHHDRRKHHHHYDPERRYEKEHPDRTNPKEDPRRNYPNRGYHDQDYPHKNYPQKPTRPQTPDRYPHYPNRPYDPRYYPQNNPDVYNPGQKPPQYPPYRPPPITTTENTNRHVTYRPTFRPRPTIKHKPKHTSQPPDKCNTSYDAIAVIRQEVFIFKDEYLWRIGHNGLYEGYPALIKLMWRHLPENFTHIDAVYERSDKKIVFFIDKMFYLFDGHNIERGYPKPLTILGLPDSLEKIDGAFIWGHNGKTYLFSGTMYWRLDEEYSRVEMDYPRDMSNIWRGVGYNIDTVFQWTDGKTYFFKGKGFWKFNDLRMRVYNEKQMPSAPFWMGCSKPNEEMYPQEVPLTAPRYINSSSSKFVPSYQIILLWIIIAMDILISKQ